MQTWSTTARAVRTEPNRQVYFKVTFPKLEEARAALNDTVFDFFMLEPATSGEWRNSECEELVHFKRQVVIKVTLKKAGQRQHQQRTLSSLEDYIQ